MVKPFLWGQLLRGLHLGEPACWGLSQTAAQGRGGRGLGWGHSRDPRREGGKGTRVFGPDVGRVGEEAGSPSEVLPEGTWGGERAPAETNPGTD